MVDKNDDMCPVRSDGNLTPRAITTPVASRNETRDAMVRSVKEPDHERFLDLIVVLRIQKILNHHRSENHVNIRIKILELTRNVFL